jgi:cytochrome c oxidase subunit 1
LRGGNIIFYQHLFWFFGHPEVYILIIPGFGLVSEIMMKKTNKIIFARDSMVLSIVVIGILGMVV